MPHKRNPISAETISGLARVVRSNLLAGLQDVALWHERDISHSSVERVILPDSTTLVDYMAGRLNRLLLGLRVDAERMRDEPVVVPRPGVQPARAAGAWWPAGASRDDAYRIVQRNAMTAWDERSDFRTLIENDPEVTLTKDVLDEAFDLERSLRHLDRVSAALDGLRPPLTSANVTLTSGSTTTNGRSRPS